MKKNSLFKQIVSVIRTFKSKTNTMRNRLIIFSLLHNRKVMMGSLSHKLHTVLRHQQQKTNSPVDESKAVVLYTALANETNPEQSYTELVDEPEDENYPDITHTLFDDEAMTGSVIDLVRNSKVEGESFSLENEIDQVAEIFINRFHQQLRLQKQQSFDRYQDMLQASA